MRSRRMGRQQEGEIARKREAVHHVRQADGSEAVSGAQRARKKSMTVCERDPVHGDSSVRGRRAGSAMQRSACAGG